VIGGKYRFRGVALTVSMKMLPVTGILRERTNTRIRWWNREKEPADGTSVIWARA
jgi:hypothetical protein